MSKYACNDADKILTKTYFDERDENERKAKMVRQFHKGQIPFCWHGCAINLPKPVFSNTAKQFRTFGSVSVLAITDESGRVFWVKPVSGPKIFRKYAQEAACHAIFKPISYERSAMKFPWSITYNFVN
jgi:hypothetical protein